MQVQLNRGDDAGIATTIDDEIIGRVGVILYHGVAYTFQRVGSRHGQPLIHYGEVELYKHGAVPHADSMVSLTETEKFAILGAMLACTPTGGNSALRTTFESVCAAFGITPDNPDVLDRCKVASGVCIGEAVDAEHVVYTADHEKLLELSTKSSPDEITSRQIQAAMGYAAGSLKELKDKSMFFNIGKDYHKSGAVAQGLNLMRGVDPDEG